MESKRVRLFDVCEPGALVTFRDRFGNVRRGRAAIVNRAQGCVVCNMGGRYGMPVCVSADALVSVSPSRRPAFERRALTVH